MTTFHLGAIDHDDYGTGAVVEFGGPDSPTFFALDVETWETLGRPRCLSITVTAHEGDPL